MKTTASSKKKNIYYIYVDRSGQKNTASMKASSDISELCRRAGFTRLFLYRAPGTAGFSVKQIRAGLMFLFHWLVILIRLPRNAVVIYQHPTFGSRLTAKLIVLLKRWKHCRFICVIHDLDSLRGGVRKVSSRKKRDYQFMDTTLLRCFDCLICHNTQMKQYLINQGFDPKKLVTLEIFDYLTDEVPEKSGKGEVPSIAIAGALNPTKSGYLYRIINEKKEQNPHLQINLYGSYYEEDKGSNHMYYKGSFPPEKLPKVLEGDFGLVWDGQSIQTCAGNTGEYLRYNNPHKMSLYLAAGMPVIIWEEAAEADFIVKTGTGITVKDLRNLENVIEQMDEEQYESMAHNAKKIGKNLRKGRYFYRALYQALRICEK